MTQGLTEWLQSSRLMVVEVDRTLNRLRVRAADDTCSDLACGRGTVVVTEEESSGDLGTLNPGDIIKLESSTGHPDRIVVVRRAWEEWASPEV